MPEWAVVRDCARIHATQFFFVLKVVTGRAMIVIDLEPDHYGFFTIPKTAQEYKPYFKLVENLNHFRVFLGGQKEVQHGILICQ